MFGQTEVDSSQPRQMSFLRRLRYELVLGGEKKMTWVFQLCSAINLLRDIKNHIKGGLIKQNG